MKGTSGSAARAVRLFVAGLSWVICAACGDDGGATLPATTAGTFAAPGAAGTFAAPAAGTVATAGTGAAGTGVIGAAGTGAAGTGAIGAAGMAAGAAGGPAAAGGQLTCATANATAAPAQLHAAAMAALLPPAYRGCAFSSCHDMNSKKANLTLLEAPADLRMQLVGKMACEAPTLPLIDTSKGDAALEKSWLWQKLVAPSNGSGELVPKPEWGTAASGCGQDTGMGFGVRMPRTGSDMKLSDEKLAAIRDWICAGAPGPM